MISTPALRDYSVFRGWGWDRIAKDRVRIILRGTCVECTQQLELQSYIISETNDAALNLSGVHHMDRIPLPHGIMPHAGLGPFCPFHYKQWKEGKLLPSDEGVI